MATPAQTQQAVVGHLRTRLPGLSTCDLYAGEYAAAEINRSAVKSPAVLVACLGVSRKADVDCGQVDWLCRYAAYCTTKHAGGREKRAVAALDVAEAVVAAIDGQRFGLTEVFPAKVTRVDNLYAASIDRAGMAIWAVTWEQVVRLGVDDWADAGGTRPQSLYVGISPEIGTGHEDDYDLVFTETT